MTRAIFAFVLGLVVARTAPADDKTIQREVESLKGRWRATSVLSPGQAVPKEVLDGLQVTWTFKEGGHAVFSTKEFEGKDPEYTYRLDLSKSPKIIDFTYVGPEKETRGRKQFGIYKLEMGKLTLCLTTSPDATEKDRPKEFAIKGEDGILLELERRTKN
jgi:uncharacterized protein (TIGR03067 family)